MNEILFEKQVGPLYHFTTLGHAWSILSDGVMKPKGEGNFFFNGGAFVIDRARNWVSFTRNKNLTVTPATGAKSRSGEPWGEVRIEFDGDKIAHRHRIGPHHDDDGQLARQDNQAEERVVGDVKISDAVVAVTIFYDLYMREQTNWSSWASPPEPDAQERYTKQARDEAAFFVRWCRERGWRVNVVNVLRTGLRPPVAERLPPK